MFSVVVYKYKEIILLKVLFLCQSLCNVPRSALLSDIYVSEMCVAKGGHGMAPLPAKV